MGRCPVVGGLTGHGVAAGRRPLPLPPCPTGGLRSPHGPRWRLVAPDGWSAAILPARSEYPTSAAALLRVASRCRAQRCPNPDRERRDAALRRCAAAPRSAPRRPGVVVVVLKTRTAQRPASPSTPAWTALEPRPSVVTKWIVLCVVLCKAIGWCARVVLVEVVECEVRGPDAVSPLDYLSETSPSSPSSPSAVDRPRGLRAEDLVDQGAVRPRCNPSGRPLAACGAHRTLLWGIDSRWWPAPLRDAFAME